MSNTFGNIFRLTTFGESHGPGVGGVVDGFPAGIDIDLDFIQHELDRRRPGQSRITTPRKGGIAVWSVRRKIDRMPHRLSGTQYQPAFQ